MHRRLLTPEAALLPSLVARCQRGGRVSFLEQPLARVFAAFHIETRQVDRFVNDLGEDTQIYLCVLNHGRAHGSLRPSDVLLFELGVCSNHLRL